MRRGPALTDNLREAARSLARARLRTLLGLIGIMIGIASVIAMISTGRIATAESRRRFEALGTDIVTVRVLGRTGTPGIPLETALALVESVPALGQAGPMIQPGGRVAFGSRRINGAIYGVTESMQDLGRLELADGRFVSDLDIRQFWGVVGAEVAEKMRRNGAWDVVGASIDLGDHIFTVAGELRSARQSYGMPVRVNANRAVFVPITTARRMNPDSDVKEIIARAAPGVFHEDAVREVTAWLRRRLDEAVQFEVTSAEQLIAQMENQLGLMTLLLAAVGSISLIVGGIGVMNVMLISVSERRREIGVRRALGASRGDIQRQFLIESVILTVTGGIAGTAFGVAATWGICRFTQWEFFVSEASIVIGLGVSSMVGIFFGYQPAHQASRLDPIVALQGE